MPKITIHTATYNRAFILHKAYESLKSQTCKDFEWIISDDSTEKLVSCWLKEDNGFDIVYRKLAHVGFPRALNDGVTHARFPWFLMLDSDDYLLPHTIEKIQPWISEIEDAKGFAGIGVTRRYPDGKHMKDLTPKIDPSIGYVDASYSDRHLLNLNMDCFEVTRTELFREYPFQYWPTEEYAPPALNYNAMSLDGWKWRWRDDMLYICSYLDDGLTRSNLKVKNNPMGYAMMYNQDLLRFKDFKSCLYNSIQMTALTLQAGNPQYLLSSNKMLFTIITLPLGIIWAIRRKIQFSKMK